MVDVHSNESIDEFQRVANIVESVARHLFEEPGRRYCRVLPIILADGFTCEGVLSPFYGEAHAALGEKSQAQILIDGGPTFEADTAIECCAALMFALHRYAVGSDESLDSDVHAWIAQHRANAAVRLDEAVAKLSDDNLRQLADRANREWLLLIERLRPAGTPGLLQRVDYANRFMRGETAKPIVVVPQGQPCPETDYWPRFLELAKVMQRTRAVFLSRRIRSDGSMMTLEEKLKMWDKAKWFCDLADASAAQCEIRLTDKLKLFSVVDCSSKWTHMLIEAQVQHMRLDSQWPPKHLQFNLRPLIDALWDRLESLANRTDMPRRKIEPGDPYLSALDAAGELQVLMEWFVRDFSRPAEKRPKIGTPKLRKTGRKQDPLLLGAALETWHQRRGEWDEEPAATEWLLLTLNQKGRGWDTTRLSRAFNDRFPGGRRQYNQACCNRDKLKAIIVDGNQDAIIHDPEPEL